MKFSVTICRTSNSHGPNSISLMVRDELSNIEFLRLSMTPEDFGNCVTGLSAVDANGEVRGLQYVGLVRVREGRSIECPLKTYSREKQTEWLEKNAQEDGWILDSYLGSQTSVELKEEKTILHYSVHKFVAPEAK